MNFIPTTLYIKVHTITGKLYFGKTIRLDYKKYLGSGFAWKRHIKKYGVKYVETVWYETFDDIDLIQDFALFFSDFFNIVESTKWANMRPENGLDGTSPGIKHTKKALKKMSDAWKNNPVRVVKHKIKSSIEQKIRMSDPDYKMKCMSGIGSEVTKLSIEKAGLDVWLDRSIRSESSISKRIAKSKTEEYRNKCRDRELSKPLEKRIENAKRAQQCLVDKCGGLEEFKKLQSAKISGRVKIISPDGSLKKVVRDPEPYLNDGWVLQKKNQNDRITNGCII